MSIKNTVSFVRSFVQSQSCKLLCGDTTEDVQYLFSGRETPLRSCGCKAQRVLDRTRSTRKQLDDCGEHCYTWYFALVRYIFEDFDYLLTCCFSCLRRASDMPLASVCDSSEGHFTQFEFEDNNQEIPYDISPAGLKRRYIRIQTVKNGPPAPHYPWVSNRVPHAIFPNEDYTCGLCERNFISKIPKDSCVDCYMHRTERPQQQIEFAEAMEDLQDLIIDDEDYLDDMRNRDMSTPEPHFEELLPVSPVVLDMSDDELDEYMRAFGYF
jgi:hypothetical protein